MKKLFQAASLALFLFVTGCASSKWQAYPGAFTWGQCAPYAQAVVADLEQHHIEAYKVAYLWRSGGSQQGAHAVVLYKATDGRWALVENSWCAPQYVKGKTLLAMVKSYDPNAVMISDWNLCPLPLEGKAIVASWYEKSKRRDGLMANGQRFNPDALTCASWSYYGKWLRVTGPLGSVVVYASDKGPSKRLLKTRSLDLSREAFRRICPLDAGLIGVTVEQLP